MTDPLYGDNPLDPELRWFELMRPPLVNDPEIRAWQAVISGAMLELEASSWLVRWRVGSVVTAEGVHLDALAADLGLLRPDGWDDERLQAALEPTEGASFTRRPAPVTEAIAAGLVQPGQTWKIRRTGALEYVVYFFGISDDEAQTYRTFLERGRPRGVGFALVYSPAAEFEVFTTDLSLADGPDVLAASI